MLKQADQQRERLLESHDAQERLHAVLEYFLLDDEDSLALERVRVVLAAHKDSEESVRVFFAKLEPGMRGLIRAALEEFVDPEELDGMVDLLRVWTSGIALSAVEHPDIWTPRRQNETLDRFLASLSLPLKTQRRRHDKAAS